MALHAKLEEHRVGWGLLKLWKRCWEAKIDVIHAGMIDGYVPGCLETLILFGFAERLPNLQVRIKGLDRYIRVRKSKPGEKTPLMSFAEANGAPVDPVEAPQSPFRVETAGKIEDRRSKTDLKEDLSLDLGLDPVPKGRKLSQWEELWADMSEERASRLEALGMNSAPEDVSPRELNAILSELAERMEAAAGESFSDGPTEIAGAWRQFLIDDWARKLKPLPFSLRPFVHPNNWRRCWEAFNAGHQGGGEG